MARPRQPIPTLDEFRTQLRRHGLRATKQRLAVHAAMMELVHASAEDVHGALELRDTPVPLTSVYNILTQLADERIYSRRLSGDSRMYFDIDSRPHIHLYDRENHIWRNVEDEELATLVTSSLKHRKFKGYTVEGLDIQLVARPTRKNKKI